MGVLNRQQFRELWNNYKSGLGDWGSPLWDADYSTGKKSRYFVAIKPIRSNDHYEFRVWASKYCAGQILCYSVDDINEVAWYGFSHRSDIPLFLLKWS